jgi:hypothetical protein
MAYLKRTPEKGGERAALNGTNMLVAWQVEGLAPEI